MAFCRSLEGRKKKTASRAQTLGAETFSEGKGKYHVDIVGKKQQEYMHVASKQIAFTVEIFFFHFSSAIDFFFFRMKLIFRVAREREGVI